EDAMLDWRQIDWRRAERTARRLRQRIFTASKAGDLPRVRRLQALMLRSRSNTLVSVRRVSERNAGRLTAGVDGAVSDCTNVANAGFGRSLGCYIAAPTSSIWVAPVVDHLL